jgi:DUF971 family protein
MATDRAEALIQSNLDYGELDVHIWTKYAAGQYGVIMTSDRAHNTNLMMVEQGGREQWQFKYDELSPDMTQKAVRS